MRIDRFCGLLFSSRQLVAAILLSAAPFKALAESDCDRLNTDRIDRVVFQNGAVIPILGREGDVLTYGMTIPGSAEVMQITAAANLFTLHTIWGDQEREMHWQSDLPGLADLVPGFTFSETASVTQKGKETEVITVSGEVIGTATVTVGQCSYPVLELRVRNEITPGPPPIEVRKWLHVPSLVVLRSSILREGKVTDNTVKEIIYHSGYARTDDLKEVE